jgi:transglutaminase-like putative cysteine protease
VSTQKLSDFAWQTFGNSKTGWDRVQTICDFVHNHIKFGYCYARDDRTAFDAYHERVGVCRDFTHLAVALCRCMNIPARYCTGYLGDIGVPPDPAPMDFSAWFEVLLEGRWFTFDARHNHPRIGRVVIARGRDAADVAISTSFGLTGLATFKVITEKVTSEQVTPPLRLNVA